MTDRAPSRSRSMPRRRQRRRARSAGSSWSVVPGTTAVCAARAPPRDQRERDRDHGCLHRATVELRFGASGFAVRADVRPHDRRDVTPSDRPSRASAQRPSASGRCRPIGSPRPSPAPSVGRRDPWSAARRARPRTRRRARPRRRRPGRSSRRSGRATTGRSRMSAWNCISSSLRIIPPSTRSSPGSGPPRSAAIATHRSYTW